MLQMSKQVEPIKEYYIAYFDLLGYRNYFESNPDKVENFLESIYEAIQNTKNYIQEVTSSPIVGGLGQVSIRVKVFSDNILLCLERNSTPMEYLRFLTFLAVIADIQRNFILQYDLFLRGGITLGSLSFNEDFIFGQGLIDAVELEESAKYPRIIMGPAILDYVLQPHFVDHKDLQKACDIENRAHSGEHISDEELAFCNAIIPVVNLEKFYLNWRRHLIFQTFDGAIVLNYLYCFDINAVIDKPTMDQLLQFVKVVSPSDYQVLANTNVNQRERLEQHKTHIIQKINEYGKYDDLDTSKVKEAELRERILKKYLWVLMFHNQICMGYGVPECMIKSGSTCDIRFMRMAVEIFENSPCGVRQWEENQIE